MKALSLLTNRQFHEIMLVFRVCVCACGYAIYTVTFALPTAGKLHDVGCPPVHGEPRPTVIRKLPTSHNSKLHHISTQLCAIVAYRDYTAVDAMSIPPQPPIPPLQCLDPGLPCPSRLPPPPAASTSGNLLGAPPKWNFKKVGAGWRWIYLVRVYDVHGVERGKGVSGVGHARIVLVFASCCTCCYV